MSRDGDEHQQVAWLSRIAIGDPDAFEQLFKWYQRDKRLFRYLFRMSGGDFHRAEELFSDVMVEVWKSAKRFRGEAKPFTWIFGIAQHKAASALRKKWLKVVPLPPEPSADPTDDGDTPEHAAEEHSRQKRLEGAMKQLSLNHRSVFTLFVQGFHYPEIAKIMGCNEATAKTRLFYAKKRLQELLTPQ
jgi:RNA polymerase sigma-70 factor (ECF subfamily)